jgi:hypothetical protein
LASIHQKGKRKKKQDGVIHLLGCLIIVLLVGVVSAVVSITTITGWSHLEVGELVQSEKGEGVNGLQKFFFFYHFYMWLLNLKLLMDEVLILQCSILLPLNDIQAVVCALEWYPSKSVGAGGGGGTHQNLLAEAGS